MPDFRIEEGTPRCCCRYRRSWPRALGRPRNRSSGNFTPKHLPRIDGRSRRLQKLSRAQREALHTMVSRRADIGIGCASVAEIEQNNILVASHIAMVRAVTRLPKIPNIALIDGKHIPENLPCTGRAIIRGDSLSLSIAAASIVAK